MCRENNDGTFWNLVSLIDKDRALLLKGGDHMHVMDDLLANVDRSTIEIKGFFNGNNSSINTGAITARRSKEDSFSHVCILLALRRARNFKRKAGTSPRCFRGN
jgi:hypothetical protein